MRSVITRYSMYFNKKYDRVGKLFQGHYKACLVNDDNYLLHLSRYIHQNPQENGFSSKKVYSSYQNYLGLIKSGWLKTEPILSFFNKSDKTFYKNVNSYRSFVEKGGPDSTLLLGEMVLEN